MKAVIGILVLGVLVAYSEAATGACTATLGGENFDLNAISKAGQATYTLPSGNFEYLADPCTDIKGQPSGCTKLAPMLRIAKDKQCQAIGEVTKPVWNLLVPADPKAGVMVTYAGAPAPDNQLVGTIQFKCEATVAATGTIVNVAATTNQLNFNLTWTATKYGCPGAGPGPVTNTGLTGGSWFLIVIFAILLPVYLIAGIAYKALREGARGVEMIPNLEFWKGLPGLVKDGVLYVFTGFKKRSYTSV